MWFPVEALIGITFAFACAPHRVSDALTAAAVTLSYFTAAPTVSLTPTLGNKRCRFLQGHFRYSFPLMKNSVRSIDDAVVANAVQTIDVGSRKAVLTYASLCGNS